MNKPNPIEERLQRLPKWARDYTHHIHTFVGAEEVQELTFLRDQNRQLVKLIGEMKAENRLLRKQLANACASEFQVGCSSGRMRRLLSPPGTTRQLAAAKFQRYGRM